MALPSRNDNRSDQAEEAKKEKRVRLELSAKQVFLGCIGLIVVLSWMFAFGILVGRGLPMVSSKDFSLRAEFIRFMGLGREIPPPPEDVAMTWEDPKKMLEALNYYEDLTKGGSPGAPFSAPAPTPAKPDAPVASAAPPKKAAAEPSNQPQNQNQAQSQSSSSSQNPNPTRSPKPLPAGQPASEQPEKGGPAKNVSKKAPPPEAPAPDNGAEHFTLLIASLRDTEKAKLLVDQLRSKGHTARLEALNLDGSGHWNRVLVGSFKNREEALRFSADFNRKEQMEALVIREAH